MYENSYQNSEDGEGNESIAPVFFHGKRDGLLRCRVAYNGRDAVFVRRDKSWYEDTGRGRYEIEQRQAPDDEDFSTRLEAAFANDMANGKTHKTVERILEDHSLELEALEARYRRMGVVD